MTAILAFVLSPIGRWIAGALVVLLMLTGHVVLGAFVLCALIVALALVGRFAPPQKPGKPKDRLHR